MSTDSSSALFIEQDGNQYNDLWLAMAVIFGVMIGFFLGVFILFIIRRNFPAMYTKADAQRIAESGLQPEQMEEMETKQDPDTYSEIVPPGVGPEQTILSADPKSRPLSWVRRQSTIDLGEEADHDGMIDALAQDSCVQMQMATISQEFSKIVKYEEDLQNQYRIIFLNLINIYLDSLVQQKMIEPEQKQEMSDEFSARLRETESEWRSKIKASIRDYERMTGDSLQANHIEELRYQAAMDLETEMLNIRESLRLQLTEKTSLKNEEIEFMEEKLVENLTMLCEIINGEYVSASKAQTGRFEVMKKAGCLQFPTAVYEPEEVEVMIQKFKLMLNDLKTTAKLSGSVVTKLVKTFEDRIRAADTKLSEEFDQKLGVKQTSCAKERVTEMKRIKTWKRNTEIASTANQSYQAAVDGLIEPSRYIQTLHELQQTVRLDKMLAIKRIDVKEGESYEKLIQERIDGKRKYYQDILSDAIGTMKLEKNMDGAMLDKKSKKFQEDMAKHRAERIGVLKKEIEKQLDENEAVRERLDREIRRQSADQEELLGEQEDAVKEVLQTQSGLTEIDREQMMAIHQHQALGVINMLFMNRMRVVKRVEMLRLQHNEELRVLDRSEKTEIDAVAVTSGSKTPNKKQQKAIQTLEQKYAAIREAKKKEFILDGDQAINEVRQKIFEVTNQILSQFDERMGVLLAKLQVSHARREGTKVKTTQVLNKIKTKLVDIIWTDGYISETACKKTLQDHHKIVQDVCDKFAVKRTTNLEQIKKVSSEKRLKRETSMNEDIQELIENYKAKEHSNYGRTQPLWENWSGMKQEIEKHNTSMELTRQVQDLYNATEDEFASNLQDEEINIILELVKMGRMDINEFDKIIKSSVTACVGGDKLYKELSTPLLEKYGPTAKRSDKAMDFWQVATDQMAPPKDPKLAAERAAEVWRARLGIYGDTNEQR